MFGDPIHNTKSWQTKPLKDIAPETSAEIPIENEYWWLNLDMIESYSGRLLERVVEKADTIGNSTSTFDDTMVLYSKLRPYLNKVIVPDSYGYATTELVKLKPNSALLDKYFLFNLLRGDHFLSFATSCSSGAQMPRMQMKVLREFECILPPIELQREFVRISEQSDKSKFIEYMHEYEKLTEGLVKKLDGDDEDVIFATLALFTLEWKYNVELFYQCAVEAEKNKVKEIPLERIAPLCAELSVPVPPECTTIIQTESRFVLHRQELVKLIYNDPDELWEEIYDKHGITLLQSIT